MNLYERIMKGELNSKVKFPKKFSTTEERSRYFEEQEKIKEELKLSILEEHRLQYHPKARPCFDLAWEFGKGNPVDVYIYFMKMEKLL